MNEKEEGQLNQLLVMMCSPNGNDEWQPVPVQLLPGWLKEAELIDRIARGFVAHNPDSIDRMHWRAADIEEIEEMAKVQGLMELIALRDSERKQ